MPNDSRPVRAIRTNAAPTPVGPYSQAMRSGAHVFLAGQVGLDPASGKLVEGGIAAQTERVLNNLQAVMEAAGGSLQDIVKTTVFLTDFDEFAQMNTVYARFFPHDPPARSTVGVARLPLGAVVEIEAVARVGADD